MQKDTYRFKHTYIHTYRPPPCQHVDIHSQTRKSMHKIRQRYKQTSINKYKHKHTHIQRETERQKAYIYIYIYTHPPTHKET